MRLIFCMILPIKEPFPSILPRMIRMHLNIPVRRIVCMSTLCSQLVVENSIHLHIICIIGLTKHGMHNHYTWTPIYVKQPLKRRLFYEKFCISTLYLHLSSPHGCLSVNIMWIFETGSHGTCQSEAMCSPLLIDLSNLNSSCSMYVSVPCNVRESWLAVKHVVCRLICLACLTHLNS